MARPKRIMQDEITKEVVQEELNQPNRVRVILIKPSIDLGLAYFVGNQFELDRAFALELQKKERVRIL